MSDDLREANVVPAYKKGNKTLAENYRPISLTGICCNMTSAPTVMRGTRPMSW